MTTYNTFDAILQNGESKQDALDCARGMVWSECELQEQEIHWACYVDTVNSIEVYYDFGADYYFFCPAD